MEESLAYTKLDLLADIGGYAGIFVGASMITVYDIALTCISNAWKVIKQMSTKVWISFPYETWNLSTGKSFWLEKPEIKYKQ